MLTTIETTALEIGRLSGLDERGRPLVRTGRSGDSDVEAAWLGLPLTELALNDLIERNERVLLARPEDLSGECVIVGETTAF